MSLHLKDRLKSLLPRDPSELTAQELAAFDAEAEQRYTTMTGMGLDPIERSERMTKLSTGLQPITRKTW